MHYDFFTDVFFVTHTDITAKLRGKGLSVKQVEDWNITVESFALFPTVPLLFDEESWRALWPIINKTPLEVREVMKRLQQEQKQNELKKKDEENRRRQQEESERLEAQKEKAQLEARKRRKINESPTQSPLPSLPDLTPEKTFLPEKAMPSSTSLATTSEAVKSTPPSVRKNSFFCFCMD